MFIIHCLRCGTQYNAFRVSDYGYPPWPQGVTYYRTLDGCPTCAQPRPRAAVPGDIGL